MTADGETDLNTMSAHVWYSVVYYNNLYKQVILYEKSMKFYEFWWLYYDCISLPAEAHCTEKCVIKMGNHFTGVFIVFLCIFISTASWLPVVNMTKRKWKNYQRERSPGYKLYRGIKMKENEICINIAIHRREYQYYMTRVYMYRYAQFWWLEKKHHMCRRHALSSDRQTYLVKIHSDRVYLVTLTFHLDLQYITQHPFKISYAPAILCSVIQIGLQTDNFFRYLHSMSSDLDLHPQKFISLRLPSP